MSAQTFVLQSLLDGHFLPGQFTWDEAQAAAEADGFARVRRLDEVLAETGREVRP